MPRISDFTIGTVATGQDIALDGTEGTRRMSFETIAALLATELGVDWPIVIVTADHTWTDDDNHKVLIVASTPDVTMGLYTGVAEGVETIFVKADTGDVLFDVSGGGSPTFLRAPAGSNPDLTTLWETARVKMAPYGSILYSGAALTPARVIDAIAGATIVPAVVGDAGLGSQLTVVAQQITLVGDGDGSILFNSAPDLQGAKIFGVGDPTSAQHAATKAYVDALGFPPPVTQSTATLTLDDSHNGKTIYVTYNGTCTVTVPQTLTPGFSCSVQNVDAAAKTTWAVSGTQALCAPSSYLTCDVRYAISGVIVRSATHAALAGTNV